MNAMKRITLSFTILGCCWASTPAAGFAPPAQKDARAASVATTIDAGTGLKVRLSRLAAASFLIEVNDDFVSIKKLISPSTSLTTIAIRGETLTVQFDGGHMSVTGRGGALRLERATPDSARQLVTYLKQSAAMHAARLLLQRLELRGDNLAGRSLLLTRALLDSAGGHVTEVVAQAHLMSPRRPALALAIGYGPSSSTGCWDTYQGEAMSLATRLETCLSDTSWWNTVGQQICAAIYVIEAEMAFAEYLLCSAHLIDG
jgi:hypothetical protein